MSQGKARGLNTYRLTSLQVPKLRHNSFQGPKAQEISSTQGTKAPEGNRVDSSPETESPPGFLELKCEVQWLGNTRVLEWRVWSSPGKRHASSVMLLLPIFVIFMWFFNVEKSFQMCHIPLLLQVAPYCDIMNCVTGA